MEFEDQEFKKSYLGREWDTYGIIRKNGKRQIDIQLTSHEAQAIEKARGIVIRVDRPGIKAINAHPSETGLDDWDFDYKIWNGSDLKSLMFTITNILQKENIWLRK